MKKTKPDLSVNIAGIQMKNPVTVGSGTFGYGPEYADLVDLNRLGAITVKGISLEPTMGNPTPRTVEVVSGLINAIGLQNPGAQGFITEYMPFLRQYDVPVFVNIWGRSIEEYAGVAALFDAVDGVAALEVNVSCPNIKECGHVFGTRKEMCRRVLSEVRKQTSLPLIAKLSPNVPDVAAFAQVAEEEGMNAISLINSIPAMAIDVETRRPILGNTTGGLSGPAIHHVALKLVYEAARAVNIPVIGMGGITSAKEALEFLIVGASAVAVGTANFTNPHTVIDVIEGIEEYLIEHDLQSVTDLVGSLQMN